MKIYILEAGEYENCFVRGVFSSKEKAFAYITAQKETRRQGCYDLREETLDLTDLEHKDIEIPRNCFQPELPPPPRKVEIIITPEVFRGLAMPIMRVVD